MEFNYKARTKDGELQNGVIEAVDEGNALESLRNRNLIVVYLSPVSREFVLFRRIPFFEKVPKREIVIFSRQLSTLFESKVPLISAMRTLVKQTSNQSFKEALLVIAQDVDDGMPLSKALAKHAGIFNNFYISMVKTGEVSGKLGEIFSYLADHLEKDYYFESKARSSLIYPAFVFVTFIVIMILMLVFVVPNLTIVLIESGVTLPIATQIIIFLSDAFRGYWWIFLIALIGILGFFSYYRQTKEGRAYFDWLKLKMPILGTLFTKIYLSRFAESLSTLIIGGLPLTQALEVTSDVIGHEIFKDIIFSTVAEVQKGATISSVLKQRSEVPLFVSEMIAVGEESGRLDAVLKNIANFYQKEVDNTLENMTSIIEPVLIVFLGIAVAVLIVAIILPIYNIAQNIG